MLAFIPQLAVHLEVQVALPQDVNKTVVFKAVYD